MIGAWSQLDQRSREVLASVVGAYILSAAPVSSRLLTKSGGFSLSSASLRNAMAELEDLGYLTHPHASAGRVPTDLGYRTYVKELMTARPPGLAEKAKIASGLGSETFELERFLHATSRVLSELTGEVAVVAAPDSAHVVLRSVHFTRVAERKVVVVTVSGEGLVGSRLIETREDFSSDALQAASNRLTAEYAGRTLLEIRARLLAALQEEKVRFDAEIARALELARQAFVGRADRGRDARRGGGRDDPREAGVPARRRVAPADVPGSRGGGAARRPPHRLPRRRQPADRPHRLGFRRSRKKRRRPSS